MDVINARRARRWFWALPTIAVLAMGALQGLRADPGPGTSLLVAVSALGRFCTRA
ncbi:hypothetical protein ACWC09_21830 [Streptomyces sp. NPDC001617]